MRNKSWWFRLRCQLAQWILGKDWQFLYRHLLETGWRMGKNGAELPWKEDNQSFPNPVTDMS